MKKIVLIGFSALLFVAVLIVQGAVVAGASESGGDKIAVVRIEGAIIDSAETLQRIRKLADRKGVVALVLRINSPGGGVAPTQEIYREILKQREQGMVVVTSMGSVAASGGYYIAAATDYIVANPGTITGSIGVIMAFPSLERLLDKIGIEAEVVKSGKYKDIGSPAKSLGDEERRFLQSLIDDVFQQFVEAVQEGRKLEPHQIKEVSRGGIYSGRQAMGLGLVDSLGGLDDAIDEAAKLAKIEGEPKVIMGRSPRSFWQKLFGESGITQLKDALGGLYPKLEYVWR